MATGSTRWHPFAEREDLHGRSDRMLAEMESGERRKWSLAVDIIERGDEYLLRADVPGIEADEIKIEVENDVLTVSAEYEESEEEEKDNYLRRERRYGSASRSIHPPKGSDAGPDPATCKDGVVEVSVPKANAEERQAITITPKTT